MTFQIFLITIIFIIITARKRSLGQGNIFAPVCHSVHRGGLPQCILGYQYTPPTGADTPPTSAQCMLGDTGNKRAVRILLECHLVILKQVLILFWSSNVMAYSIGNHSAQSRFISGISSGHRNRSCTSRWVLKDTCVIEPATC